MYSIPQALLFATLFLISVFSPSHGLLVSQGLPLAPYSSVGRSYRAVSLVPRHLTFNGDSEGSLVKDIPQLCASVSSDDSTVVAQINGSSAQELNLQQVENAILALSTRRAVLLGMLLALCSGFVNGSCLSGIWSAKQATAAVTGSWTNSAISLAQHKSGQFLLNTKYILSYIGGSTIGGLLMPEPIPFTICAPRGVSLGFGLSSLLLLTAGLFANVSGFANANFLCLCLMANGIQNSFTSSMTANLCRTAHFSGISSDIGTFLGQFLRGNRDNLQKLKVFPLLALSFWVGGFVSYPLTRWLGSRSLLITSGLHAALATTLGIYAWNKRCADECLII